MIVAVVSAVLAILDGDPKTVPNWETTIAAVTAGFGLVYARDNKVTRRRCRIEMRTKLLPFISALVMLAGCGTLDPTGVYQTDRVLYDADLTISTSYEVIHSFVLWEFNNRAALAKMPNVKAYADSVRREAPLWFSNAFALRDAYAASPGTQTQVGLQRALAVLREAVNAATRFMAQTQTTATP